MIKILRWLMWKFDSSYRENTLLLVEQKSTIDRLNDDLNKSYQYGEALENRIIVLETSAKMFRFTGNNEELSAIDIRTSELVKDAEKLESPGEYKKFQVCLSRLMKEFPEIRKRNLCFVIEKAVQRLN